MAEGPGGAARQAERSAMRRALALAAARPWAAHPRPTVAAVLLDPSGAQICTGVTDPDGPHAEVVALRAAGERARGATLVVTLEPCAAAGRTGACTDAVRAAGVRRVVYAAADPLPGFGGGGAALRAAGVDVLGGVLAAEARAGLAGWLRAAGAGRPVLTWKVAATLDGRTAAADATSRWITGPAARREVHRLRSRHDAVLVGVGTVLADDPQLTARDEAGAPLPGGQPLRVVADTAGRTPPGARVLGDGALVALAEDAPDPGLPAGLLRVPRTGAGVSPAALLEALAARGVRSVLLEGGARLAASFAAAGLVDRLYAYFGARLLGAGAPVLAGIGVHTMSAAQEWRVEDVALVGGDVRVIARPAPAESGPRPAAPARRVAVGG